MGRTPVACMLTVLAILFSSVIANASTITPLNGQLAEYIPDAPGGNFLYIAPPNNNGISINRFSRLDINESLFIYNAPRTVDVFGGSVSSAETVVLIANDIELGSNIDIVGPATDLIFFTSTDDGSITCNNCVINNALRLSLIAAGYKPLDESSLVLGDFNTSGQVYIDSLYASGVVALDVVAGQVHTAGVIDINQSAIKSTLGGYVAALHGSYQMGTGGIDVVNGDFIWNYEGGQFTQLFNSTATYVLGGEFNAPRVNISSTSHLVFSGRVDTRVEEKVAVSYKGATHTPLEGITLQALSSGAGDGVDLNARGNLYSDGTINLRGTRDVLLDVSSEINAPEISILSGQRLLNKASVVGASISVAAEEVINEGIIDAQYQVELWANNDLSNQYGGVIRGKYIYLDSANSVVRNGSRTPYRTSSENRNNFLALDQSDILNSMEFLGGDPSALNSSELGTYYLLPSDFLQVNNAISLMPASHKAHIIGGTILVRAPAFENINPYYEGVEYSGEVLLERQRINQVMISAEDSLEIQGAEGALDDRAEYVLNSSALMVVNSTDGRLRVQSSSFINQRYRIATYLVATTSAGSVESDPNNYYVTSMTTSGKGYVSETKVYSPPGFVSVMGLAEINAEKYFANIMGYFEVFGGAEINSIQLRNFGLQNQGAEKVTTTTTTVFDGANSNGNHSTASVAKDPSDLDSLFYVSGYLNASDSDAWFGILNPFHYFLGEAVESLESQVFGIDEVSEVQGYVYNPENCASQSTGCESRNLVAGSLDVSVNADIIEESIAAGRIDFNFSADVKRTWGWYGGSIEPPVSNPVTTETGTASIGLWETLDNYYEIAKAKITALIEEFDWWGLAA